MEQTVAELKIRDDVIEAIRELARHGANVRQMVEYVQSEAGLRRNALLPVLWYFMEAFHLPLGDVLPIREWLGNKNDQEIDRLILPAIQRSVADWSDQQ